MSYELFTALHNAWRIKFSLEPIAYTGFESAGDVVRPSFNVTLRAKSTHSWVKVCSSGRATMEVTYSGVTSATPDVQRFCLDPKREKVITLSASPGWPVRPSAFMEQMETDRQNGGIQMEINFGFRKVEQAQPYDQVDMLVRCPATLDADQPATLCKSYIITSCC